MDIEMPELDGISATKEIYKMLPEGEACTVVAVTAWTSDEIEKECIDVGMSRVLGKPINVKALKEVLDQYFFNE